MKKEDLPDYLQKAFVIFVEEFQSHLDVFNQASTTEENLAEAAEEISRRFHTIKGGAGFLQLSTVADVSAEGEKLFRDSPLPKNAFDRLKELTAALQVEYDKLEK